ncbi:hypothetical protein FRC19_009083 [Serendipita sp. 401]|nr:hypothetical protein FRC19_009083 [Serendipita sp. 401]
MDDLPTWSFGLGELGMESPTKTQAKSELDQGTDAPTSASKSLPNEPSKDEVKKSVTPLSAVPRGLQEGTNSASQTPLTQTPTTYLDNQSSAGDSSRQQSIATSPDTPVIHHHVVDDPTTRGQGNSGRFAMFPDKRKPTLDSFPVHLGSMISSGAPEEDSPRSQHQHDQQPKSILVDSTQQSRSGTQTSSTGHYDGASGTSSKIHFAPRPPSPITPSPVTGDSTSEEASAKERTDKDDRRLSAITPLGLHKNKDGSQPTTPHHGAFLKEPTLSEDQFNAMLDSFEEQLGSPNTSSNAPTSAPESGADTSIGSNASKRDDSMSSTGNVVHTRSLEAVNESSLDSTAAVAGSPFPSPTPTNTRPAQSFSSMSATSNNSNSLGGFTGIGNATYGAGGGRRPPAREPTEDDDSDSSPVKTISAGAFKRGGAPKQGHSGPTPSLNPAPTVSPPIQARATSGGYTDGPRSQDYHTDHEDTELPYQSPIIQGGISQPSYFSPAAPPSRGSDQGHSDYSGAPSVYQTPQETPNFGNLPPGAAAPARFGPPQGEQASYNQSQRDPSRYSNQSLSYSGSMEGHSPRLAPPPIPSSLLPARPGSAAPLASIGHVPSSPNRQISPPPNSSPYMSPSYAPPRGTAVPPWQQQPQQYRVPSPMNDGNVGIHDAYGGISNEPAYGRAPAGGQGSWNAGASSYNPNQAPRGWNGS